MKFFSPGHLTFSLLPWSLLSLSSLLRVLQLPYAPSASRILESSFSWSFCLYPFLASPSELPALPPLYVLLGLYSNNGIFLAWSSSSFGSCLCVSAPSWNLPSGGVHLQPFLFSSLDSEISLKPRCLSANVLASVQANGPDGTPDF